jgi:hypothetical protein
MLEAKEEGKKEERSKEQVDPGVGSVMIQT